MRWYEILLSRGLFSRGLFRRGLFRRGLFRRGLFGIILLPVLVLLDRYTKMWALKYLATPLVMNQFVTLEFALNRGISWGLFHGANNLGYILVTCLVAAILVAIGIWTWRLYCEGKIVCGQILILAGGVSNLVDRIFQGGVIDFISLSVGDWQWPIFNFADIMIDLGVLIVVIQNLRNK